MEDNRVIGCASHCDGGWFTPVPYGEGYSLLNKA